MLIVTALVFLVAVCPSLALLDLWSCVGCRDQERRSDIVGIVHRALYLEHPNVYYQIHNGWVTDMQESHAKVTVREVKPMELSTLIEDHLPLSPVRVDMSQPEEFKVLFVEFPELKESKAGKDQYMGQHSEHIDSFLTMNPCWIPLHEPSAYNYSYGDKLYSRSAVLVHLPRKLTDTCTLYKALVKRQFPQKCIYNDDNMRPVHPHNIGWSHTIHHVQGKLLDTLKQGHTQKVLIAARADSFDGQHQDFPLVNGTMYHRDRSRWYWANEKTCPLETILFNPWACNFISFTNCSTRASVLDVPQENDVGAFGDHFEFTNMVGVTQITREKTGDQPMMSMNEWLNVRTIGFLQRPNARLRQMIRRSFHRIYRLTPDGWREKRHDLKLPCIAMHVRHGDSVQDSRGEDKDSDRTIHAHVEELVEMMNLVGTNVVFLMTDNSTLHRIAPQTYPSITWLMQQRPIKEHKAIYRVNNEDDIQLELSHLIADVSYAGTCRALIGCFDSGVTVQIRDMAFVQSIDGNGFNSGFLKDVAGNLRRKREASLAGEKLIKQ